MGCLHQPGFDVFNIWKCIPHFVSNRHPKAALRLLVEVADRGAMSIDNSLVSLFNPCKDFDEGGLAGAVDANDADAFLIAEDKGNVLEDSLRTKSLGNLLCG